MTCGGSKFYFPPVMVHAPQASITADPMRVEGGAPSVLTGTGTGVISCYMENDNTGAIIVPSSLASGGSWQKSSTQHIAQQTEFSIHCKTRGADVTDTVIVNGPLDIQEF